MGCSSDTTEGIFFGFSPWGKLSPKVTDEGRPSHDNPFMDNNGKLAPHPALRATFPLGGRLFL